MNVGLFISALIHALLIGLAFFSVSTRYSEEMPLLVSFPTDIVSLEEASAGKTNDRSEEKKPPSLPAVAPEMPAPSRDPDPKPAIPPLPAPFDPEQKKNLSEPKPSVSQEPGQTSPPKRRPVSSESESSQAKDVTEKIVQLPERLSLPFADQEALASSTKKRPENEKSLPVVSTKKGKKASQSSLENEITSLLKENEVSNSPRKGLEGKNPGQSNLSESEMDHLRQQIQLCWNLPAGVADGTDLRVSIQFRLNRAGEVEGSPRILTETGGSHIRKAAAESARRAILRCAPYRLPPEKYESWSEVTVNFDPRDML